MAGGDGAGTVRRCHFVPGILGNLYEQPLDRILAPRISAGPLV
jgi:hypothetical protein